MHRLFGILYLDDKRTDIDNKGNHLKKFKSLFDNKEYMIKTKKTELHRTYAIINKDNTINEYINQDFIDDNLFSKISLCNWSLKINRDINKNINDYLIDITPNRINYDGNIISVDPNGCKDIDDAISYKINCNKIEIGIHIADPSSYINFNSHLGKELINRIESIYLDKVYNMIPEDLAINHISLIENKNSRAYSLIITFNCDNIEQISNCIKNNDYTYKFIKTNIKVSKNLSYDEFESNILNNTYYNDLYKIGKEISIGINQKYSYYDSHNMIEAYMILCNHLASKHTIIKRTNNINKENSQLNINSQLYNNCLQNSAIYTYEDNIHKGIGLKYTHFTSPMRRYIDFINHIIIYNNLENIENLKKNDIDMDKIDLDNINKIHSYYKKIYNLRNINILLGENQILSLNGIIIFIEDNNLKININDKIINVCVFNKKLIDNKIVNIIEKTDEKIIFKYRDKIIKFELFQNINITVYRNKMEIKPFKFIIDDIEEIFE